MWVVAALACVALVGAWLLPIWMQARHDPAVAAYLEELVVTQTVGRYVTPWHHFRPPWYYLQVMLSLWLPLFLLLPWLVPRWRDALRAREARVLLPLGFVALYVAFFALSSGKRDVYILSALPVLALPAGYLLPQLLRRAGVQRVFAALVLLISIVAAAATVWATAINPGRARELLAAGDLTSVAPLAVLAAVAVAALAWAGWSRAHLAFAATTAAAWLIAGFWVFPQMNGARSASNFITRVEALAAPERELGLLAYHEHFLWQLRRATVNFGHRRFREGDAEMYDAAAWLAAGPGRQLLVPQRMLQTCFAAAHSVREVGESSTGLWYLVQGEPAPACVARGDAAHSLRYAPPTRH
jgi:4-amino-4-deoxy-L-arabinose transferase-like glycosyltransferase